METVLYIKDMVCVRCKMAVEAVLKAAGVDYLSVTLGKAVLAAEPTPAQRAAVQAGLKHYELALMQGKTTILVERIKTEIISLLRSGQPLQLKLSVHLSQMLGYNYTHLANTFSEQESLTLERYFISRRVERVKELMVYDELSLTEITDALAYSSVSHLCLQFKKVTGITPAEFRRLCGTDEYVWKKV